MSKAISLISKAGLAFSAVAFMAGKVLAASYDYNYSDLDALDAGTTAAFTGLSIVSLIIPCCFGIIGLVLTGFWIWMIIDVVKRTETELPDKTMWVLIVILLSWIGSLVYYFSKKRPLDKGKK